MAQFHAHIYFDGAAQRESALLLRDKIGQQFPNLAIGRVHDQAIGPHSLPMFQVVFETSMFEPFLSWLMCHRKNLDILIHPMTGNAYADHIDNAMWLGKPVPIFLLAQKV